MRDFALFVGWGHTYPGREPIALKHFAEWEEILTRAKAEGEIEDYETVLLGPHGGELDGFTLLYGTPEKIFALQMREDLVALQTRAMLDHAKFSVIPAIVGEGVEKQFSRTRRRSPSTSASRRSSEGGVPVREGSGEPPGPSRRGVMCHRSCTSASASTSRTIFSACGPRSSARRSSSNRATSTGSN